MVSDPGTGAALASTAGWTAAIRAEEYGREDRILSDPWAGVLAGAGGRDWLAGRTQSPGVRSIAIRSRFFDDFLQETLGGPAIRQVVLLAAGFDTRAFRLSWPVGTHLFELDQPPVLRQKDDILTAAGARAACARTTVGTDLAGPWVEALVGADFDPTVPSCWVLEGLLFYLPERAVLGLLDRVGELAAAGSRLGFDVVSRASLTHPLVRPWLDMQAALGAPWRSGMDDPAAVLASRGWTADVVQVGEGRANYGRFPYPVPPRHLPDMPRHWLVTARKE